jgi:alpha-pyrone synthase
MTITVLGPIATANPPYCALHADSALNTQRLTGLSKPLAKRVPAIYKLSGIDRRFTCIEEYAQIPGDPNFDPPSWAVSPYSTTAARNKAYRQHSVPLGLSTAQDAIDKAGVNKNKITHVIVTSCTGFFAPGLDIELVKGLGLRPNVARTLIGFMGCYASFNALRVADSFCKSDPKAIVLVVCLELCSLHYQVENTMESVAVNSLFADGCAAVVVRSLGESEPHETSLLSYEHGESMLNSESGPMMSWDIGDHGFIMGLSSNVPDVLHDLVPGYVDCLIRPLRLKQAQIEHWAIHPGGRRIVEQVQAALSLSDDDVAGSLGILHDYGNMSSPTILFVIERMQREREVHSGDHMVAMGFGPGLTIEGCVFRSV